MALRFAAAIGASLEGLDHTRDYRNGCGTDLLAFVARNTIENARDVHGELSAVHAVARIEGNLGELHQWRRTCEIRLVTEVENWAGGKAGKAAQAIERGRRLLHLSV